MKNFKKEDQKHLQNICPNIVLKESRENFCTAINNYIKYWILIYYCPRYYPLHEYPERKARYESYWNAKIYTPIGREIIIYENSSKSWKQSFQLAKESIRCSIIEYGFDCSNEKYEDENIYSKPFDRSQFRKE